jgi:hypothetical protein
MWSFLKQNISNALTIIFMQQRSSHQKYDGLHHELGDPYGKITQWIRLDMIPISSWYLIISFFINGLTTDAINGTGYIIPYGSFPVLAGIPVVPSHYLIFLKWVHDGCHRWNMIYNPSLITWSHFRFYVGFYSFYFC